MKVAVLGAGHAGVKAAETLSAGDIGVTLYSDEPVLPYFRPRLIALAFGQAVREELFMHPAPWYEQRNIRLLLDERVESFDAEALTVTSRSGVERYDALIVAFGAGPFLPPLATEPLDRVRPLWSMRDADVIRDHVGEGTRLAIVGGGILGIEAALRAVERGARVTVLERLPRLMPMQFGETAADVLEGDLLARGIRVLTGSRISTITRQDESVVIHAGESGEIPADEVIVSVGARRHVSLSREAGLSVDKGLLVDAFLRTSHEKVWAAGDIIQLPGLNRCSAVDAAMQGRVAALNVQGLATGEPWQPYRVTDAAVNFKFGDFELHAAGRLPDEGDREEIVDRDERHCRIRVLDAGNKLAGAQLIGTGADFKAWVAELQA